MATKINVPKKLETKLRTFAADDDPSSEFASVARQLVALMDDAAARRERVRKLSPHDVVRVIRRVIPTAILPPNPGPAFYGYVTNRINFLGLTLEDVERAAERARVKYRQPTSVEYIIRTIDRLVGSQEAEEGCDGGEQHEPYTGRPRAEGADW